MMCMSSCLRVATGSSEGHAPAAVSSHQPVAVGDSSDLTEEEKAAVRTYAFTYTLANRIFHVCL